MRIRRLLSRFAFALVGFSAAHPLNGDGRSGSVFIAVASDLVFCLPALHAEFARAEPGVTLTLATGSSGNFFAQIRNGAPFDVFLSADLRYPRELVEAQAADGGSLALYAIGRLVLWTTRPELELAELTALVRNPAVRKIAIANPTHAPYGRAAKEGLESSGVWRDVLPKLVLGENIAQAAQFVQTGSVDAGIVAFALVKAPVLEGVGRWHLLPGELHAPLEQGMVLTTRGAANPAAARYLAFLRTPAARAIFERYGFRLPPGGARERDEDVASPTNGDSESLESGIGAATSPSP